MHLFFGAKSLLVAYYACPVIGYTSLHCNSDRFLQMRSVLYLYIKFIVFHIMNQCPHIKSLDINVAFMLQKSEAVYVTCLCFFLYASEWN